MTREELVSLKQELYMAEKTDPSPFQKGRFVKHYAHGVGVITDITEGEMYGAKLRLIHVQVGSLKLQVPAGKAEGQLFLLSTERDWDAVFPVLATRPKPLENPWHRAAADLATRLEVGTLMSVCEVLRDTAQRGEDPISISRREIFDTALTRLVEEYRVTFGVTKEVALVELQKHCPFDVSRKFSERQNVVTRTRNIRRAKTGDEGYRELYQPKPRVVRETVPKPPKIKREPKVKEPKSPRQPRIKMPREPRPSRAVKPKPLNKQQQILALTEKVDTLTTQLDAAGEALANDQNAEAAKIAELAAMLAKAEETVRALTRERGILRSQVTRLKKGRKAPSTEQVSGKEIKRQIALVRAELFQYIFERTSAVERLEAYIKEQVDWPKT